MNGWFHHQESELRKPVLTAALGLLLAAALAAAAHIRRPRRDPVRTGPVAESMTQLRDIYLGLGPAGPMKTICRVWMRRRMRRSAAFPARQAV